MQLLGLMESYLDVVGWVGSSVGIDGITPDADRVLPGYLFVALPGAGEDGHSRVHQALLKGAAAVLGEWPSRRSARESSLGSLYLRARARRSAGLVLAVQQLGPPVQTRRRLGS